MNKKIGWFSPGIDCITIRVGDVQKDLHDYPGSPEDTNTEEFQLWIEEKCIMEFDVKFEDVEWIHE
jgi:hypothetical protein